MWRIGDKLIFHFHMHVAGRVNVANPTILDFDKIVLMYILFHITDLKCCSPQYLCRYLGWVIVNLENSKIRRDNPSPNQTLEKVNDANDIISLPPIYHRQRHNSILQISKH